MKRWSLIILFSLSLPVLHANDAGVRVLKTCSRLGMSDFILKKLLENDKPNLELIEKRYGRKAIHWCVLKGRYDSVKIILENSKLEINPQDNDGKTPLHYASENNDQKMVELLLQYGADPSVRDEKSKLPLDYTNDANLKKLLGSNSKSKIAFEKVKKIRSIIEQFQREPDNPLYAEKKIREIATILGKKEIIDKDKIRRAQTKFKAAARMIGLHNQIKERIRRKKLEALSEDSNTSLVSGITTNNTEDTNGRGNDVLDRMSAIASLFGKDINPNHKNGDELAEETLEVVEDLVDIDEGIEESKVTKKFSHMKAKVLTGLLGNYKNAKKKLDELERKEEEERKRAEKEDEIDWNSLEVEVDEEYKKEILPNDQYNDEFDDVRDASRIDIALRDALFKNWEKNGVSFRKKFKKRYFFCGVFNVLNTNDKPAQGVFVSTDSQGTIVEHYGYAFEILGNVRNRNRNNIQLSYDNRHGHVYLDMNRPITGASSVTVKSYRSDQKEVPDRLNFKVFQYFKMKDLEKGKEVYVPFMPKEGLDRWLACQLKG